MYYYLLYNSSLINNNYPEQKFIVVLSFGSILYMITHGITFHTDIDFLKIFRSYFWNIFMLDITILGYKIAMGESQASTGQDNLKLSINLLKNKIYDMMEGNNTIKIAEDENTRTPTQHRSPERQIASSTIIKNNPMHHTLSSDIDMRNPFDATHQAAPTSSTTPSSLTSSFKDFPSNPLVYNPKIDILPPNQLGPAAATLPPPMVIKKGSPNDHIIPGNTNQRVDEPISTNIKYGFSTTTDDDFDNILAENKSIASDIASVIDLEGF